MTKIIEQAASFPNVTPAELYGFFMDSAKHSAATGMPAKVSGKVGGKWSAFGGMILGKTLALVPNRMIVQAWRSSAGKRQIPIPSSSSALKEPKLAQPPTSLISVCRRTTIGESHRAGKNIIGSRGRNISRNENGRPNRGLNP